MNIRGDERSNGYNTTPADDNISSTNRQSPASCIPTLKASAVGGAMAGAAHGMLYYSWDVSYYHLKTWIRRRAPLSYASLSSTEMLKKQHSLSGTLLSHSMAHCYLFCAYETVHVLLNTSIQDYFLHQRDYDSSRYAALKLWVDVSSVCIAGSIAGVGAEVIGHYTESWETYGLKDGWTRLKLKSLPSRRLVTSSLLPSAVGFLAYEFSKS